jgi:5-methylcytosine-specific restriction protein A
MPDAPLRFCATPQCPNKVKAGHCTQHQRTRREARRFTQDARYGTHRWRLYSRNRLAASPWCVLCGQLAEVTDHIVPVVERPDLFWAEHNHRSLCQACNKRRASAFGREPTAAD